MIKNIFAAFVLCLSLACPLPVLEGARPSQSGRSAKTPTKNSAAQEERLIAAVNNVRQKHGLAPLSTWTTLSYYARQHSQNMANKTVGFGHSGFEERAKKINLTARCLSVGENLSYCYLVDDPLKTSVEMWMKSPDHRENILGDYAETGMGIAYDGEGRCYITQLFSKKL